jgi:phosphoribosylglycinamide formyltransferase-1
MSFAQAIREVSCEGHLAATIELVVSSREDVRGVRIAEAAGIPVSVVSPRGAALADFSHAIFDACERCPTDLLVMAGFLHLVRIPASFAARVFAAECEALPEAIARFRR